MSEIFAHQLILCGHIHESSIYKIVQRHINIPHAFWQWHIVCVGENVVRHMWPRRQMTHGAVQKIGCTISACENYTITQSSTNNVIKFIVLTHKLTQLERWIYAQTLANSLGRIAPEKSNRIVDRCCEWISAHSSNSVHSRWSTGPSRSAYECWWYRWWIGFGTLNHGKLQQSNAIKYM